MNTSNMANFATSVKFLVAKVERSDLCAIGGFWSQEQDGGDPREEATLIKTCTYVIFLKDL
jgi:hypothetical protein